MSSFKASQSENGRAPEGLGIVGAQFVVDSPETALEEQEETQTTTSGGRDRGTSSVTDTIQEEAKKQAQEILEAEKQREELERRRQREEAERRRREEARRKREEEERRRREEAERKTREEAERRKREEEQAAEQQMIQAGVTAGGDVFGNIKKFFRKNKEIALIGGAGLAVLIAAAATR